jgi:hypothetical protein
MAVTYYSPDCRSGNNVVPRAGIGICSVSGAFNIATVGEGGGVAFIDEDVLQLVKIPAGATILDWILDLPPLESSTGLVWDLGDADSTGRFATGCVQGRSGAGAIVRPGSTGAVVGGTQYAYTVDDTIDFHVTTVASGTPVTSGIIKLTVFYTFDL